MNNDLISREALKEGFKKIYHCAESMEELANAMEDLIDNAPTVYPICEDKACKYRANERPQGEWVRKEDIIHSNPNKRWL